jgi:SAM-dependent methyltransferase
MATDTAADDTRARQALSANPAWYHTIELAPGVVTPGYVDWRAYPKRILPTSLAGLRALDIGTYDGFWAFEMERRGANVVAIDLDRVDASELPPLHRERLVTEADQFGVQLGQGFRLARECLGSSVNRVTCNVMELEPEAIGGEVDFAFIGALLLHLRDPVRGLENIRATLRPGGTLIALEGVCLRDTLWHPRVAVGRFNPSPFDWWLPNVRALEQFIEMAGFERVERIGRLHRPPAKPEMRCWYASFRARTPE